MATPSPARQKNKQPFDINCLYAGVIQKNTKRKHWLEGKLSFFGKFNKVVLKDANSLSVTSTLEEIYLCPSDYIRLVSGEVTETCFDKYVVQFSVSDLRNQRTPNAIPNSDNKSKKESRFKKFKAPARVQVQTEVQEEENDFAVEDVRIAEEKPRRVEERVSRDVITEEEVDSCWGTEPTSRKRSIVEPVVAVKKSRESRSQEELLKLFE